MPLTNLKNIPVIMTAVGWNKAADLLNNWFSKPAYTRSSSGITAVEYANAYYFGALPDWLFKQPEAKVIWEKIFNNHLWRSSDKDNGDAKKRLGKLLNDEGILKPGIKDVRFGFKNYTVQDYEKTKTFLNLGSFVTNPATTLTHCVAALGSFVLKIALNGKVSHTPVNNFDNFYTVTPESIDIYLWDLFDFEDDGMISQPLGFWDEVSKSVSKYPLPGLAYVNNASFRDWRAANGMGCDFYIYSDVLRFPLTRPSDLEPFVISKP